MSIFENGSCQICRQPATKLSGTPGYSFCSVECLQKFTNEYTRSLWLQLVSARDLLTRHTVEYPQGDGFTIAICQRALAELKQVIQMPQHVDGSDLGDAAESEPANEFEAEDPGESRWIGDPSALGDLPDL